MTIILQGTEYANFPEVVDDFDMECDMRDWIESHEVEWWFSTTPPYWEEAVGF